MWALLPPIGTEFTFSLSLDVLYVELTGEMPAGADIYRVRFRRHEALPWITSDWLEAVGVHAVGPDPAALAVLWEAQWGISTPDPGAVSDWSATQLFEP